MQSQRVPGRAALPTVLNDRWAASVVFAVGFVLALPCPLAEEIR
jgi:hypothetical protein